MTAVCVAFVAGILPAVPTYCQSFGGRARLLSRPASSGFPSLAGLNRIAPETGSGLKTSYINACRAVGKGICDE